MPIRKRQHGFTIIELIVTMTILGLMLFLVNQLFNDTTVAVQTSVQSSKTIATNRSINEQLTADTDAMVGPGLGNSGGYIVIIQQRIQDATMINPSDLTEVEVDELRTDQLLFIRDGEGLKSMTPATASGYGTNFIGQPGDRAKVWYGHALRTLSNGRLRSGGDVSLGGDNAKFDSVGNNFILGRQAMLFNPTDVSDPTNPQKLTVDNAGFIYADQAYWNAPVNNTGYPTAARTFKGLTDMTFQPYGPHTGTNSGSLLDQLTDLNNDDDDYVNTAYPSADERLRVNTAPNPDDTDYAAWAIAQGHAILAQGCSEIIVDFAADLNGNGRIDRVNGGGNDTAGTIYWYDTFRRPLQNSAAFQWDNPQGDPNFIQPLVSGALGNQNVFVFRVDDDEPYDSGAGGFQSHSRWPYMIRIRYRLHDTRGRLRGNYAAALRDLLDNDGDGDIDEAGEDQIAGRWFERIISVPRP
jgi:prepilin-type N-terminal cleavage/methylation domain-containing protein